MNRCSLCEKIYLSEEKFNIYLCYDCHNKTSFCMNCDKIMSKIFNNTNTFKCEICNKVTPAISKQLVEMENPDSNNPNRINNLSNLNDINEKYSTLKNNLNFNSPNENKFIYPLTGNKMIINTPSAYSSFLMDLKNINIPEKNEEKNNKTNLSNINTQCKINKNFHLINNKKGIKLLEDKKKNPFLQLNEYRNVNQKNYEEKKEFGGHLKNK